MPQGAKQQGLAPGSGTVMWGKVKKFGGKWHVQRKADMGSSVALD